MFLKALLFLVNAFLLASCTSIKQHLQDKYHKRVIGGDPAGRGQVPWMVSLQNWLLYKAAHCVYEQQVDLLRVRAGILYLNETEQTGQTIYVDSYRPHPDFSPQDLRNDIALLYLKGAFVYDKYVSPTQLPASTSVITGNALLAGWGSISLNLATAYNALQFAYVPIIDHEVCVRYMSYTAETITSDPYVPIYMYHICAGSLSTGATFCSGDSGGALERNNITIGVASWTIEPCRRENTTDIYTATSYFSGWIWDNTNGCPTFVF